LCDHRVNRDLGEFPARAGPPAGRAYARRLLILGRFVVGRVVGGKPDERRLAAHVVLHDRIVPAMRALVNCRGLQKRPRSHT
jgi:hypothetical protein